MPMKNYSKFPIIKYRLHRLNEEKTRMSHPRGILLAGPETDRRNKCSSVKLLPGKNVAIFPFCSLPTGPLMPSS